MSDDQIKSSPFLLENESAYQRWRRQKLRAQSASPTPEPFRLGADQRFDPVTLSRALARAQSHNFILFESNEVLDKPRFIELNRQLGLAALDRNLGADQDRITSLRVLSSSDARAHYIPYTDRALNWHTDGYYNEDERSIHAFSLYCVSPAELGGDNFLFDHEMMYLLIRDTDPELIAALMRPDMMTIPANVSGGEAIRPPVSCPVFSIDAASGRLRMRYTSRPRNIVWHSDQRSQRALGLIREILMQHEAAVHLRLGAGQGLICNNLLHGREAFRDQPGVRERLVYRARYYDFIETERDLGSGAAA